MQLQKPYFSGTPLTIPNSYEYCWIILVNEPVRMLQKIMFVRHFKMIGKNYDL